MNKSILLGGALAVALSAPAMAADFHALKGLQGAAPAPLQDGVLAATEGGAVCGITSDFTADGLGAAYCGFSKPRGGLSVVTVGVAYTPHGKHTNCQRTVGHRAVIPPEHQRFTHNSSWEQQEAAPGYRS